MIYLEHDLIYLIYMDNYCLNILIAIIISNY